IPSINNPSSVAQHAPMKPKPPERVILIDGPAFSTGRRATDHAPLAPKGDLRMPAKPSTPRSTESPRANGRLAHGSQKPDDKILFQKYFKSVGRRTYAAQLKEAGNGNHFLVLTEGKRDPVTNEVKKLKLFIYSEDFAAYFRMLHETAQFIKAHPVSPEIKIRRIRSSPN